MSPKKENKGSLDQAILIRAALRLPPLMDAKWFDELVAIDKGALATVLWLLPISSALLCWMEGKRGEAYGALRRQLTELRASWTPVLLEGAKLLEMPPLLNPLEEEKQPTGGARAFLTIALLAEVGSPFTERITLRERITLLSRLQLSQKLAAASQEALQRDEEWGQQHLEDPRAFQDFMAQPLWPKHATPDVDDNNLLSWAWHMEKLLDRHALGTAERVGGRGGPAVFYRALCQTGCDWEFAQLWFSPNIIPAENDATETEISSNPEDLRRFKELTDSIPRIAQLFARMVFRERSAALALEKPETLSVKSLSTYGEVSSWSDLVQLDAELERESEAFTPPSLWLAWFEEVHRESARRLQQELRDLRTETVDLVDSAPEGCVYISYASPDLEVARYIDSQLRDAGLSVWIFDQAQPSPGWEQALQKIVSEVCGLFISVISESSASRVTGFNILERSLAAERLKLFPSTATFYIPVRIDRGTPPIASNEPSAVQKLTCEYAIGGKLNDRFLQFLKARQTEYLRGLTSPQPKSGSRPPPSKGKARQPPLSRNPNPGRPDRYK